MENIQSIFSQTKYEVNKQHTMEDFIQLICPHCQGEIIIHKSELACTICRHAVYKSNGEPINPHTPKPECERLKAADEIRGCGGPFRVVTDPADGKKYLAVACDYI